MCSNISHAIQVSDMGLELAGYDVSPFLKIGEKFALSHSDGKDPSSKDFEKITCRIGAISRQSFCSSRGRIWSGPRALSGFKPCSNLMMPFTEILRSYILGY